MYGWYHVILQFDWHVILNSELDNNNYLLCNRLCLNMSKTKLMVCHIYHIKVSDISNLLILKFKHWTRWSFQFHWVCYLIQILTVFFCISWTIGVINSLKYHFLYILMLHNPMIFMHLNYCLLICDSNIQDILLLWKKVIRSELFVHTLPLFKLYNLLKLEYLYKTYNLIKVILGYSDFRFIINTKLNHTIMNVCGSLVLRGIYALLCIHDTNL